MSVSNKKTLYVGSFYDFTDLGVDEFTCNFRDSHDDPDRVPFLSYERDLRCFVVEIERDDERTIPSLCTRLDGAIEASTKISLYDEIRCQPIEGILIDDRLRETHSNDGSLVDDSADEDVAGQNVQDSLSHITSYWRPSCGDVTILPRMFATEISDLTDTQLFLEPAEKRYRILGLNHAQALQKLKNVEPLLDSLKGQQTTNSTMANGNILVMPSDEIRPMMEYVRVNYPHPAFQRIITNAYEQTTLNKKLLGELRQYDNGGNYSIPENLRCIGVSPTKEVRSPSFWDHHIYQTFGSERNLQPRISKGEPLSTSEDQSLKTPAQARIAAWTDKVIEGADPEVAPEEPVVASRRRVVADSDSDSETDSEGGRTKQSRNPISLHSLSVHPPAPPSTLLGSSIVDQEESALVQQAPESTAPGQETSAPILQEASVEAPEIRQPQNLDTTDSVAPTAADNPQRPTWNLPIPQSTPRSPTSNLSHDSFPSPQILAHHEPTAVVVSQQRGNGALQRGRTSPRSRGAHHRNNSQRLPEHDASNYTRGQPSLPLTRGGRARGAPLRQNFNPPEASRNEPGTLLVSQSEIGADTDYGEARASRTVSHPSVPPGFENYTVPLVPQPVWQETNVHRSNTTGQHGSAQSHPRSREERSAISDGTRSIRFSDRGSDYMQTSLPPKSIHTLREQRLKQVKEEASNKKAPDMPAPRLHSTMNQQGRNPGKARGKKPNKNPQPKADSKPDPESFKKGSKQDTPVNQYYQNPELATPSMSATKKAQMKQNPELAKLHPDIIEETMRTEQFQKLVPQLKELFEIARAFNGKLSFQAQIGQVLVSQNVQILGDPSMDLAKLYDSGFWAKAFEPQPGKTILPSSFTKILTTNGAEVDRALEMKMLVGKTKIKAFEVQPSSYSVVYEFSCQSRANEAFQIAVDHTGKYELVRAAVTTGMINLHCPGQIWDASFVLSGHLQWLNPPAALSKSIEIFVQSLYVLPDREKLMMVFQQPSDHEMEIRNLVVRRVSYHACNMPECQKLQLEVTETKTLLFKKHPEDPNLWQAFESVTDDHQKLMDTGRVHYEMSLIHTGINEALTKNQGLEFGELTDEATTGKSLVQCERDSIYTMLDMVVRMISKLDFMGLSNIGTQQRRVNEEVMRKQKLTQAAESRARSIRSATGPGQSAFSTHIIRADVTSTTGIPVPGIRANTLADIYTNPDGSRYRLGLGGAKIPVAKEDVSSATSPDDSVMPDDSMSQVGRSGRPTPQPSSSRGAGPFANIPGISSFGTSVAPARQYYNPWQQQSTTRGTDFW